MSGGINFTMPYFLPSGAILRIYSIGSFHSSSVGLNVGASGTPPTCALDGGSRLLLRSTEFMSRRSARRALRGMFGITDAEMPTGLGRDVGVDVDGGLPCVAAAGLAGPAPLGTCTMPTPISGARMRGK